MEIFHIRNGAKKERRFPQMKCRVFNISQYEVNPKTGEDLHFNEENIKNCISHKSIKQYGYILHDKDICIKDDEVNGYITGEAKPRHWHVVLRCDDAIEISTIAKWLGIPENMIDVPKGRGAFLECIEYLTHEHPKQQALGKYFYPDDEVIANFDFRKALDEKLEKQLKYGGDLNLKDQMMYDVLYYGKTLAECAKEDPYTYMKNCITLEKYRHKYLAEVAQVPVLRINFYIDGPGGIGKNTASKLLAKILFPNLEKPYFEVGGSGVNFQSYDGEPVIIWNDKRAVDFITEFGRGETFDILDSHPTDSMHNIKYGQTKLINSINIINGIESYTDFINGLSGEFTDKFGNVFKAEDKSQAQRRVPIILCLEENTFDILINKGVAEGTREFDQYYAYQNLIGNFAMLAQKLEGQAQLVVGQKMLQPAVDGVNKIKENENKKISSAEDIPDEFKDFGTRIVEEQNNDELPFQQTEEEKQLFQINLIAMEINN